MKNITTLVEDIYGLFAKDVPLTNEQVDGIGKEITTVLKSRLALKSERRGLSMSSLGNKCLRQVWYKVNRPELAEPIPAHTKIKFLYGDILEALLLGLAKASGHKVEGEQDALELMGVPGHRDAVIDGVTVDVKSANSRGFEKFRHHKLETEDPFGYLAQIGSYVEAGTDDPRVVVKSEGAFLAIDKELGNIALDRYRTDQVDHSKLAERVKRAVESVDPPERGYHPIADGKSGNEQLCMECRYCPHKKHCWPGLRKFIYSNGPRWLTRVVREPEVTEVAC